MEKTKNDDHNIINLCQKGIIVRCPVCGTELETVPKELPLGGTLFGIFCPKNRNHYSLHMEPVRAVSEIRAYINSLPKKNDAND